MFLLFYVILGWLSVFIVSISGIYKGKITYLKLLSHFWIAGLALLIEKKRRRSTLAIYCSIYSIECFNNQLNDYFFDEFDKLKKYKNFINKYIRLILFTILLSIFINKHEKFLPKIVTKHILSI
jgi:hypothetical protein